MTAFVTIAPSDLAPDKPMTTTRALALYGNPQAIAQGDATVVNADRIDPKAVKNSVTGSYRTGEVRGTTLAHGSLTTSYAEGGVKIYCPRAGVVNVRMLLTLVSTVGASATYYAKIYTSGIASGTERELAAVGGGGTDTASFDEDITVVAGDTIEVWVKKSATFTSVTSAATACSLRVGNPLDYADYEA
jgi:hypothetical protein